MIKRCPSCNRTYSDESIAFCLADGSLLSAPFDPSAEAAPQTAILPSPTVASASSTQPAKPAIPTITSLPQYGGPAIPHDNISPRKSRGLLWAVIAIVLVALLGGIAVVVRTALRLASVSASPTTQASSPMPVNSPAPTVGSSPASLSENTATSRTTPPADKKEPRLQADPVLFPPDSKPTSSPATSTSTDSAKIFRSSEVDQKAKILSQPKPSYTEEARKNQVSGVVELRAVFSSNGSVTSISATRGLPDGLTERAIAAAKQIQFVPAIKDGHPVSVWVQIQYNFNLY
jgi:TonB family protein